MDMIVCQNLTKRFGNFTAVNDISFSVAQGELFGFLGPNGAGKTTTIKMITGLLKPTTGRVIIGGFDIEAQPLAAKRSFGYIPDNSFLYEKLTGREFLNFMADLYSVSREGRARRIDDLLRLFALESKGDELIGGYSRGMRQKIALAGALIHSPQVILLDEPTVGLDPKGARTMQEILRELCRRGTTVFISTHILEIAERMCDRVAIVNQGRMIALGTMPELRELMRETPQGQETGVALNGAMEAAGNGNGEITYERQSLEEIFLRLTGDSEQTDVVQYLGE